MRKIILQTIAMILLLTSCNSSTSKNEKAMEQNIGKDFGEKYAAAWSGQNARAHANFFAPGGSQIVNNGTPAVGRDAIAKVAQGFMTAFPDMLVVCDSLPTTSKGVEFHWTLTGTNTGPNGTGKKIHISGVEILQFNSDGLITESNGSFDEQEYNRQLKGFQPRSM
ncbi:MAG TPA: nuclear transport factor 2 family protein [Ginsengibacter sp.]